MRDIFGYQGKRVVITGAASGMGQAAARLLVELGTEVYALDVKEVTAPVKQYINTDLMQNEDARFDKGLQEHSARTACRTKHQPPNSVPPTIHSVSRHCASKPWG